jgi:hypothetical protein
MVTVEVPPHPHTPHHAKQNVCDSNKLSNVCSLSNTYNCCHYIRDMGDGITYLCGVTPDVHQRMDFSYVIDDPLVLHNTLKQTVAETIDEEAHRIVYGDRERAYDDPNRNFRKLAYMISGVLDEKLKISGSITPNDVALILECLKISRESFKPSRENRVDGIGYWLCLDRIVQEQEGQNDVIQRND